MGKKNIAEMTDEDIDGLSPEELLELQNGSDQDDDQDDEQDDGDDQDGDDDQGDGDVQDGDDDQDGGADGDDEEDDGEGGDQPLTREQLERLTDDSEDDEDDDPASDMVPRARLNSVLERSRDQSLVIRALLQTSGATTAATGGDGNDGGEAEQPPDFLKYDFKAKQREVLKLIAEGDEEGAARLSDEIEDTRAQVHNYQLEQARNTAVNESEVRRASDQAKRDLTKVAGELWEKFPFLNNTKKGSNEAAILAVNAKAKQLVAKGRSPAEALREAGEKIGGQFAKVLGYKPKSDAGAGEDGVRKPAKDVRSKDSMRRGLHTQQPPRGKSGVGTRDKLSSMSIHDMTDEQLERLEKTDPAALAELRGDNRIG